MPITPQSIGAGKSEAAQGTAFMFWCAMQFSHCPDLEYMHHIPNGGERNIVVAAGLKAQGVRRGVPDYMLPVVRCIQGRWYAGLWIELKKPKGGKKNDPDQLRWAAFLKSQGYFHALCLTWVQAADVVKFYYSEANLTWRDTV